MLRTVYYDDMTAFQAQMVQCGPSPGPEINLRDVLDADFEQHRGTTGQRRTTLSRLGVESGFSIIYNGPEHSIEAPVSPIFRAVTKSTPFGCRSSAQHPAHPAELSPG